MSGESRRKETKKNDGRIQSEEYICYCAAVLPINRLKPEDGRICPRCFDERKVLKSFFSLAKATLIEH